MRVKGALLALAISLCVPASALAGPARFAPYFDITLQGKSALANYVSGSRANAVTVAFIVSGAPCEASWGGLYGLGESNASFDADLSIADARAAGSKPLISFGGAAGHDIARTCTSVSSLAAQYQAVIDRYAVRSLDFDVEGSDLGDADSITRRSKAIARVQQAGVAAGKPVTVSLTLPVSPGGLGGRALDVVQSAITEGVDVAVVNVMAMDYFDPSLPLDRMGDLAIDAARSVHSQLATMYPDRSSGRIWRMIGVTPMIGINDDPDEVFTISDAQKLTAFARKRRLGRIAMWSANRDQPCPGTPTTTQDKCSGTPQDPFGFSTVFEGIDG